MKILIATNNEAKYKIIKKMFESVSNTKLQMFSLKDVQEIKDIEETGNNTNRAKEKALNAFKYFDKEFDYYVGIDDGIIIDGQDFVSVKDHLEDIICNDAIKIGAKIDITRAYYMISKEGKYTSVFNKIPYILIKKLGKYELGGYPLNDVLSTVDDNEPLSSKNTEELNKYFIKYSLDDIIYLINNIEKEMV